MKKKKTEKNPSDIQICIVCILLFAQQAPKVLSSQHHRLRHSSVCHHPLVAESMNRRNVHTVAVHSLVTIRWNGIFKTNTNNLIRCMSVNFAIDDIVRKTHWPRTRVYSIADPVVCWNVCSKHRPSKMYWDHIMGHHIRGHICSILLLSWDNHHQD